MSDDDRTEDALRRVLAIEAQQVQPTGDGLSRIQQRVGARQSRMRWLRPALAGAAAVIVVGGAVGGYAIANNGSGNARVIPADSGPPTPAVTSNGYPAAAIFPFTNTTDEQAWETQYAEGNLPWISDPTAVTESWIEHYLLQKGDFTFSAGTSDSQSNVTVSRTVGGGEHVVTVVHLLKYQNAWLVTGASDPAAELQFSTPAADAAVTSPVTVSGPGYGVDEQATVEIRNAETPDLFGHADTGPFGNGSAQWSASVPFTATSDAGVVVATVASSADGKVAALAAEKVTFGSSGSGPVTTAGDAYAVQGGSLVAINPQTGASDGAVPGVTGTVVEVHQYGDSLYYTVRVGDCLPTLYSVPTAGGTPTAVATAEDTDDGIVGFDLSPDGSKLAYLESSGCHQSMAGTGALVFENLSDQTTRTIDFPSEPPAIMGDPVWESDNLHVDAFLRAGNQGYLARYDSTSGDSADPSTNACSGYQPAGGMADAIAATAPDGTLWFANQTGTSIEVVSCANNTPKVEFNTTENDTPTSLAVSTDGKVLLEGDSGNVYEWPGQGQAKELSAATAVTSVTW
ncbi:MAG TPA: hypothetical protein VHW74_18735 [Mycobacteriales bacterium]|jgi:hypothetical protein|nr:hypothetical protein [Mycobacteriales bacterium]